MEVQIGAIRKTIKEKVAFLFAILRLRLIEKKRGSKPPAFFPFPSSRRIKSRDKSHLFERYLVATTRRIILIPEEGDIHEDRGD